MSTGGFEQSEWSPCSYVESGSRRDAAGGVESGMDGTAKSHQVFTRREFSGKAATLCSNSGRVSELNPLDEF